MRRLTQILAFCAIALAVAFLAAACGTGAGSSIKSLLPSKTISVPSLSPGGAGPTRTPTAQPSAPSPAQSPGTHPRRGMPKGRFAMTVKATGQSEDGSHD